MLLDPPKSTYPGSRAASPPGLLSIAPLLAGQLLLTHPQLQVMDCVFLQLLEEHLPGAGPELRAGDAVA